MIYLHHYPASLFSEKVRLLLGHYGLTWQSVEISSIMPRPLLMPLSGGYRKTPVLQIGANVFADTKIICKALARHVGDDGLYAQGFAAHRAADWADNQLFRVTVALNFRPEALEAMMGQFSEEEAAAFAKDRAELSGDQPIVTMTPQAAMAYLEHALAELDADVAKTGAYLFGNSPSIADFSVFHNIWFLNNNPVNASLLTAYDGIQAWFARMQSMGHGEVVVSDGQAALAAAKSNAPTRYELHPTPTSAYQIGDTVSVTPIDYGCIPVSGALVGISHDEVVIQRETPETGEIHNHFPQAGFEVTAG